MQKKLKKSSDEPTPETQNIPEQPPLIPEASPEPIQEDEAKEPTEEPAQEAAADPEPEAKRKPGRPKLDPGKTVEDIWDVIAKMKPGMAAYVYRQAPFTNKLMSGARGINIKKWDVPFDSEELLNYAGSGCYQIQVTEKQADGTNKRIRIDDVKLLDMNRPPRIPPGEWVEDPRNKEWLWAKEIIFKKEDPAPKVDPYMTIMEKQMERQYEEMAQLRKDIAAKDGQVHPLVALFAPFVPAIVQKLTAPPPTAPAAPDPVDTLSKAIALVKGLQPEQKESPLEKIAAKLLEDKLTGKEDAGLSKLVEIKKQLDELSPPTRSGRKDGWDHAVEMVEAAAPIISPLMAPLGNALAMGMMGPRPQQQQAPPQAPPMPPPAAPLTEPQQQPAPAPRPQAVPDTPTVSAFTYAILDHIQHEWSGLDLGDWYLKKYGQQEFADIQKQGKAEVITLLKSVPDSWKTLEQFHTSGKLESLIEEFLEWEPPEEEQPPAPQQQQQSAKPSWSNPAPVGVEVQQ